MSSNPSKTGLFLLYSSVASRQRDKAVSLLKVTLKNMQLKIQNKGSIIIKVQNRAQKNPGSNFDLIINFIASHDCLFQPICCCLEEKI